MENGEEQTCGVCGVWKPKNQLVDGVCIPCFNREKESEVEIFCEDLELHRSEVKF